ncbi:Uncharacterised protein [Enterococcus durans]|uniref:DpnD/PcfM-like C-terminal domain-containing protein n=2 Tax=Enterococcus durans TaxID=53345 RepID=A0A377KG44_9ENTE|nr:Uncharacterised protein [Enterococcus durans]
MFYKIRIIETLEKEFEIEAKNEKEALEKIQIAYDNEEIILYPEDLDHKEMKIVGYKDTFIEEYETLKRAFYDYDTSYILLRYGCLDKAENESWYKSFSNGDVILEINKELLKEGSGGTSPIELQTKLIDNLKAKFGDKVADDFYTSLQTSFNFNPVIVDGTKGLTISKQNDDQSQWLNTWFLDTEKTEQNTKIVLRNDFPFEWVDWRNDARHREAYKNIFTQLDWDNDLSYEVVGINLTESKKNVEGVSIAFVIMKYNEKLDKWQVTGSIGGII